MEKDVEKLLARAKKPLEIAPRLHQLYQGKIEVVPRCRVRNLKDFDVWYTPGVAAPCREIAENEDLVYEYTSKWNTVAVISDGTRVLGLGDIGPKAAIPVMEGKALLYKYLGGVDAFPICLDTKNPDLFIENQAGGPNPHDDLEPDESARLIFGHIVEGTRFLGSARPE